MFKKRSVDTELRLDHSCAFIPVSLENDINISPISGTLFLNITKEIILKSIEVRLVGSLRIPRHDSFSAPCQRVITADRKQVLAVSRNSSFQLPVGRYEFPFEIRLSQRMMDTVTGIGHSYHSYEVQGLVRLGGHFQSNVMSSHPIRIHHAFTDASIGTLPEVLPVVAGNMNENLRCHISIPSRKIPFGASFPVKFGFSLLQKESKPGKITIQITETHLLKISPTASDAIKYNSFLPTTLRKEHVMFRQDNDAQRYVELQSDSDLPASEVLTTMLVHLPHDMQECTQDVRSELIKVHHNLYFEVEFETGPAKRIKVTCTIPFEIYMSSLTIMEHDIVYRQNLQELEVEHDEPPPPYRKDPFSESRALS